MDGASSPDCFLSLVLPAYNEADGIEQAVYEADSALAALGHSYEIVVVDDGSKDETANQVRAVAERLPRVRLVRHEVNQGYGAALRTGFAASRGERIAFTDADCQFHLADLAELIDLTERHPIAVGYRADRQDSPLRKFYSRGYNLLTRTLLDTRVRDIDCALKVFRRQALDSILPETNGFFVNTEMLTRARQRHLRVAETGVRHRPRERGRSKVSVFDIPRTLRALLPFWWSQVMFPRRELQCTGSEPERSGCWRDMMLLLLITGLLLFGRLGVPLLEPEEARYAEIPRQMLSEGTWITPVLHGEAYYHKPPLLYWLVMGCYALFGVHDWAARLVPAVATLATVLVAYAWAARAVGRWSALAGAGMLALSAKFLYQGGMLTFDSVLCFFVVAALACAQRALDGPSLRRGWWTVAGLACGLGVLTKGPVALALTLPPLALWQWLDRRPARVSLAAWSWYLLAALMPAGPWFVLVVLRDPSALADFFWLHNLVRYVAPLDHEEPIWFYLPGLLVGTLPWSLLLAPCTVYLTKRSPSAGQRRPAALGFFLIAFVWCVAFFSLAGCKRAGYILPAYPLLALILGTFLAHVLALASAGGWLRDRSHPVWARWAHRATICSVGVAIIAVGAAAARGLWSMPLALSVSVLLLVLAAGLWQRGPQRAAWRGWAGCAAAVFGMLLVGVHQILPSYHAAFGLRKEVSSHTEAALDSRLPVASYPKRWDSISFYLGRNDVDAYSPAQRAELIRDLQKQGQTLLFVKQGDALRDLIQALPRDLEFVPQRRHGNRLASGIVQSRTEGQ